MEQKVEEKIRFFFATLDREMDARKHSTEALQTALADYALAYHGNVGGMGVHASIGKIIELLEGEQQIGQATHDALKLINLHLAAFGNRISALESKVE